MNHPGSDTTTWIPGSNDWKIRVADLLTDHTYALPWSSDFDINSMPCGGGGGDRIDADEFDFTNTPKRVDDLADETVVLNDGINILDRLFTHITVHLRCDSGLHIPPSLLTNNLTANTTGSYTKTERPLDSLSGSASAIWSFLGRLLEKDKFEGFATPATPTITHKTPMPPPPPSSSSTVTSPPSSALHITVIRHPIDSSMKPTKPLRRKPLSKADSTPTITTTVAKHACLLCDSRFTRPFALKEHVRMKHEKRPPFTCKYCGHGFRRPALVRDHVYSRHLQKFRYICHVCQKGFVRRAHFARHEVTCVMDRSNALPSVATTVATPIKSPPYTTSSSVAHVHTRAIKLRQC